jgi:hypothetical protein
LKVPLIAAAQSAFLSVVKSGGDAAGIRGKLPPLRRMEHAERERLLMKDIFRKIGQGLSSLATEFPVRQETLASANEELGINGGAELVSPPEVGSAPAQGPSTRKSFAFMEAAKESQDASPRNSDATENASRPYVGDRRPHQHLADPARLKKPTLLPGSDGEHALQVKYGAKERALGFYGRQVLSFLSPLMRDFISRQEFLFVATSDRHGECDCTSKFGEPGFIRALSEKYLAYPEYRGNGVFANYKSRMQSVPLNRLCAAV